MCGARSSYSEGQLNNKVTIMVEGKLVPQVMQLQVSHHRVTNTINYYSGNYDMNIMIFVC